MLTRSQMEAVIANGGSVLFGGRLCQTIDSLPTPADLGEADPDQAPASLKDLEAQHKALEAQITRLKRAEKAEKAEKHEPGAKKSAD